MEDTQVTVLLTIMINAAHAVAEDTSIILGAKPREADIPVREELFTINVNLVLRLRQVLMALLLLIILLLVVLLDIQQHGLQVVVQVEDINGMDTITFYVLFVDV